jgi:hypothetical protein
MADDFIACLSRANVQLVGCLTWSIDTKHLKCALNLLPIAQTFAAILEEMGDRQEENLKRRRKMKLVKTRRN